MVVHPSDFALFTQRLNADLGQVGEASGGMVTTKTKP